MRGCRKGNIMSDQTEAQASLAAGTWIGREQAFNAIAHHCSAARVACLKHVRDTAAYQSLNLTWDQFCPEHAGISRAQADRLIGQLAEFGAPYFQLTDIVPVSPTVYREIAPAIDGGVIEFRGEQIPITQENAIRIKAAVNALRKEVQSAESDAIRTPVGITSLLIRFDACFEGMRRLIQQDPEDDVRAALRGLVAYTTGKLNELSKSLN
jgi:hypothetical protein